MTEAGGRTSREERPWQALLPKLQLEFYSAHFHYCSPEWRNVSRVIRDEMLHIVHRGTVHWRIGKEHLEASAGEIVFCPPNVNWEAWRTSDELIQMTVIHFDAVLPGGHRYLQTLNYPFHIRPSGFSRIEALARSLCRTYRDEHPGHELKERALFYDTMHRLFPYHGVVSENGPGHQMLEIAEFLKANLHEPINRDTLARRFHLSSGHLAALFKQYLRQSPIDYLISLRVESAARLLRGTAFPINEVARSVGYDDVAYFSRIFKRQMGVSPMQYRKEQQNVHRDPSGS